MKLENNQIDKLNAKLVLTISQEDFLPAKKKKLNERRKVAEFKGFRKGMVPASLIEKVYGEQCLADAVNDIISEQINNYVKENNLNLIGEPLSSDDQPEIDWTGKSDMVFKFDLAAAPEITIDATKDDKVVYYAIKSTKKAKDEMKKNLLMQYGDLEEVEAAGEESYIYVDLKNDDKQIENAYISVRDITEECKNLVLARKAADTFEIDINKAFGREGDRATLLKVKPEELANINPVFQATVVNVKNFVAAKACQETYDKIYGPDKVHSAEEFEAAVSETLENNYKQEADYRLSADIKTYFLAKANLELPEAFLNRWLKYVNKEKFTEEQIDAEFQAFLGDYKWQLIREHFAKKFDVQIEQKDIVEAAEAFVSYQYAMYGMSNVPQEFIRESAHKMLEDRNQVNRLFEQVEDQKVFLLLKDAVTLDEKSITVEKFRELK